MWYDACAVCMYCMQGRSLGEVTKYLVYNMRKRQKGGDSAEHYFDCTEQVRLSSFVLFCFACVPVCLLIWVSALLRVCVILCLRIFVFAWLLPACLLAYSLAHLLEYLLACRPAFSSCLSPCSFACLSVCLPACSLACLSARLSAFLLARVLACPLASLLASMFFLVCLLVRLLFCWLVCLPVCLPAQVAGIQDTRFQSMMPDPLHWLGVTKIHRFISMSDMKYDAIVSTVSTSLGPRSF